MKNRTIQNDSRIPTAARTLRLVEMLMARPEGWSPQELVVPLDLSRSALFALLHTMKELGYVEQSGKRGRYTAGPRLRALSARPSPAAQDILTAFYQECEQSSGETPRETLALALPAETASPSGSDGSGKSSGVLIVAQVESPQQVRSAFSTGQVYADLLAAVEVLSAAPGSETVTRGYALSAGAETIDLALPVCRDGCLPEAALLLSAPAHRWTEEHLLNQALPRLREMAAHLSYRLGAPFYAPYQQQPRPGMQRISPLASPEISAFLRGPWAASLACIRPDSRPHVIPVWQEWDGQDFYVIAWHGSQWAEYLRANPAVSLTIDEPWSPLRRVVVQGSASVYQPGPAGLANLLQRMARRYLGQAFDHSMLEQVECAFTIHPETLRGWRGLPVAPSPLETATP